MNVDFSVYRQTNQGRKTGVSDALLNIGSSGSTLTFTMEERNGEIWVFKGAKFYAVDPSTIREQKDLDIKTQLTSGQTNKYQQVFSAALPAGISVSIPSETTLIVTDAAPDAQGLEYLLWIQNKNDSSENDYVDPGIRNKW